MDRSDKKHDMREIKTTEAIYDAFLDLIERFSFAEITVKSICDQARISRSTFYDHFEDKYHMLKSLLKYLSDDTARDFVYFGEDTPAALPMLALNEEYSKLFREIFFNHENAIMRDIYHDVISGDIADKIMAYHGLKIDQTNPVSPYIRVTAAFYAGGIMSVMKVWAGRRSGLSQDDMAKSIRLLLRDMHNKCSFAFAEDK